MAESSLSVTFTTLRESIAMELGWDRTVGNWSTIQTADANRILEESQRVTYQPPRLPGERSAHMWSFKRPTTTLTTSAPNTTGTVTIVSGVVTFTDSLVTNAAWIAADGTLGELVISSGSYDIASYDSATQVTLVDTTVNADALTTFTLRQVWYLMPDNFNGVEGPITFDSDTTYWHPIVEISESEIRRRRMLDVDSSRPSNFATLWKNATESASEGQRVRLTFYPIPEKAYVLEYRYNMIPDKIDASTPYPLGGEIMAELLLSACRWKANDLMDDGNKPALKEDFYERLAAAVQADRQSHSPDRLGRVTDPSTVPDQYPRRGDYEILVNGVITD